MELQKAKILLEKINALHKSMGADPRNVSAIERDLMRSYVRQLYEVFLDLPMSATSAQEQPQMEVIKSSQRTAAAPSRPEPAPAPKPAPPAQERQVAAPPAPKPVVQAPPPPPVVEAPPAPVVPPPAPAPAPVAPAPAPAPAPVAPAPVAPAPAPVVPPPAHAPYVPSPAPASVTPPAPKSVPSAMSDSEFDELFSIASAKEISEKLSQLPISDIKKAMGINERILNVKELFGSDQAAFEAALDALNRMASFEEAKHYLAQNVAGKYGWNQKDRKETAKGFVKLVKRRFG